MSSTHLAPERVALFSKSVELYVWTALTLRKFKIGLNPLIRCKAREDIAEEYLEERKFSRYLKGQDKVVVVNKKHKIILFKVEVPTNVRSEKIICDEAVARLKSVCENIFLENKEYKGAIVSSQSGDMVHLVAVI